MNRRTQALRNALKKTGRDALVSLSPVANQYLAGFIDPTGFIETNSAVILAQHQNLFLCDFRHTEQALSQVQDYEVVEVKGDLALRAGERLRDIGAKEVAFEPAALSVAELTRIEQAFQHKLTPASDIVANLRKVKSKREIEAVRAASRLAEAVLADLLGTLQLGVTERELAARFEYEFKRRGASAAAFNTIALFGERTSLPHGEPGDKPLERGDIILLDFGCRMAGYCSDLTRTYVFGTIPGAWFEEIYDLTLTAQRIALETVRPGKGCRDVDAAARNLIAEAGHGEHFGHGLGHGVGIEIHEIPRLNAESDAALEKGMVVTIEPGIYLPGHGGVRIEDLVVLTKDGCEVLTTTPKELRVLQP